MRPLNGGYYTNLHIGIAKSSVYTFPARFLEGSAVAKVLHAVSRSCAVFFKMTFV